MRSLRYYEEQRLLDPQRTAGGQRVYTAEHRALVAKIQELFQAGFCSAVVRELLPALSAPMNDSHELEAAFAAAEARLVSEKQSIEAELSALLSLRAQLGLASDTHVSMDHGEHDSSPAATPASFDHRDRRLR